MKKIYLFSILLMGVMATGMAQTNICSTDPNAQPKVTNFQVFRGDGTYYCVVSLTNFPTVAQIVLRDDLGNPIPINSGATVETDAAGQASFVFDCNAFFAWDVQVCRLVAGIPSGCCTQRVPPQAPLPVKLTAFTGRLQNDASVILDWTSVVEFNSYKYEIQRSEDGLHFTKVGDLAASGNSNSTVKYTFNDQLPYAGAFFYRLKQIDFNGTFENSKVVYVNSKKGAGVVSKLFPNPTRGEIQIVGATSVDLTPKNLNIFSIAGQRVKYRVVGANAISLDATAPDGVYILKMQTAAGLKQFKIVKNQGAGNY